MKRLFTSFLGVTMLASMASAQQFWDKKPYEDWSKEECKKMLEKSPWVQKDGVTELVQAVVSQQTDLGTDSSRQVNYLAQIRSALPMRQAVVQAEYLAVSRKGAFTPAEKQKMRGQAAGYLSANFDKYVVIHFLYGSNIQEIDRQLARYWQQQTSDKIKDNFNLVGSNGKRVAAVHYEVAPGAGREFEVTFPRLVDGAPIVTEADKSLAVEFTHPAITDPQSRTAPSEKHMRMQFTLKDMVSGGKLVY